MRLKDRSLASSKIKKSASYQQPMPTKEEVEGKIFNRFTTLNDKKAFHNYFTSYDFRENEKDMVDFWKDIVDYYYESIFGSFALKVSTILDYSKFKGKNPIGLPNILVELKQENFYIRISMMITSIKRISLIYIRIMNRGCLIFHLVSQRCSLMPILMLVLSQLMTLVNMP